MPTPQNASVIDVDISNIVSQTPDATKTVEPVAPVEGDEAAKAAAAALAAKETPAVVKPVDAPAELTLDAAAEPIVANESGVAEFDTVGKLMADKGLANTNEILAAFMETGELTLEHKASMVEALGDTVADMAIKSMESAAEGIVASAKADSAKTMDYANTKFNAAEGADTWGQIQEYVRGEDSPFDETALAQMNTMLAAGGLQAELVIDRVHQTYTNDANVSTPGNLLEADTENTGLTFEPISRADYVVAMGKATREHGEDSPQVRALDSRRTKSMNRGY